MAFPIIAEITTAESSGIGTTDTLPASILAGDLILVFFAHDSANENASYTGFTELAYDSAFSYIFGKVAVGGETTATFSLDSIEHATRIYCRIASANWSGDLNDIDISEAPAPNPPALTPVGGSADYLWIVSHQLDRGFSWNDMVSEWSTGFTDNITDVAPGYGGKSACAIASRELSASSLSPTALTVARAGGTCFTVAVPPSGGGGPVVPTVQESLRLKTAMQTNLKTSL